MISNLTKPTNGIPTLEEITRKVAATEIIAELQDVKTYVQEMDFSWQKYKMKNDRFVEGWSYEKLNFVETQYKNFLFMWRKHRSLSLPPSHQVDDFWHGHILDTGRYSVDCKAIFGGFLHHYPYFGVRGEQDRSELEASYVRTQKIYKKEFGDWIRDFIDQK